MPNPCEVPAICEDCLGDNPYLRMTREQQGAECKLCTRPFTVFKWKPDRKLRPKRTVICQTCARQKNACQSCMLDLTYRIPISVRDAALAMVEDGSASTSTNAITKQYLAQNFERQHENEVLAGASKELRNPLNPRAAALLHHISTTRYEPYTKKDTKQQTTNDTTTTTPTNDNTTNIKRILGKLPLTSTVLTQAVPTDKSITSFFVMGIEEDLPEYAVREFFEQFGQVSSATIVHRARSGFATMASRGDAESAARQIQILMKPHGYFVVQGVRLRAAWSKPRSLGETSAEQVKLGQVVRKLMKT